MAPKNSKNGHAHSRSCSCYEDLEEQVNRLAQEQYEMMEKLATYSAQTAAHEEDLKEVKPKPTNWLKILGMGAAAIVFVASAMFTASHLLYERPTYQDVEKIITPNTEDIKEIRKEQSSQRSILDRLDYGMQEISGIIKDLEARTPNKRPR